MWLAERVGVVGSTIDYLQASVAKVEARGVSEPERRDDIGTRVGSRTPQCCLAAQASWHKPYANICWSNNEVQ